MALNKDKFGIENTLENCDHEKPTCKMSINTVSTLKLDGNKTEAEPHLWAARLQRRKIVKARDPTVNFPTWMKRNGFHLLYKELDKLMFSDSIGYVPIQS